MAERVDASLGLRLVRTNSSPHAAGEKQRDGRFQYVSRLRKRYLRFRDQLQIDHVIASFDHRIQIRRLATCIAFWRMPNDVASGNRLVWLRGLCDFFLQTTGRSRFTAGVVGGRLSMTFFSWFAFASCVFRDRSLNRRASQYAFRQVLYLGPGSKEKVMETGSSVRKRQRRLP